MTLFAYNLPCNCLSTSDNCIFRGCQLINLKVLFLIFCTKINYKFWLKKNIRWCIKMKFPPDFKCDLPDYNWILRQLRVGDFVYSNGRNRYLVWHLFLSYTLVIFVFFHVQTLPVTILLFVDQLLWKFDKYLTSFVFNHNIMTSTFTNLVAT